ncbi:hypothetical protein HaLaN_08255, partial [Haematococcus lacustris]
CVLQAELDGEEPLAVSQVHLTDTAATQLTSCWAANQHRSLYSTPSDFIKLVTQVGVTHMHPPSPQPQP